MKHVALLLFAVFAATLLRGPFAGSFDSGSFVRAVILTAGLLVALFAVVGLVGLPRGRVAPVAWGALVALAVAAAGSAEAYGRRADEPAVGSFGDYLRLRAQEGFEGRDLRATPVRRRGGAMWWGFFVHWALPLAGCIALMRFLAEEEREGTDLRDVPAPPGSTSPGTGPWSVDDLYGAVNQKDVATVRAALAGDVSPDARDPWGEPLVLVAARLAPRAAVEAFLDHGADPRIRDPNGRTLLHAVVGRASLVPLVDRLLAGGLGVDERAGDGHTPLMAAARAFSTAGMERMLAAGADPAAVDDTGATVLHHLVRSSLPLQGGGDAAGRRASWIRRLVDLGVDPRARDGRGDDALRIAAASGQTEELSALLEALDGRAGPGRAGDALVQALLNGREASARILLDAGAPVDFWAALLLGDRERVEEAVAADPDLLTARSHPRVDAGPLAFALRGGDHALAIRLLELGADPAAPAFGGTLFGDALAADAPHALFRRLLAEGYPVLSRDGDGRTPLHQAAAAGRPRLVRLLLRHGAPRDVRTERGATALDVAANDEVRRELETRSPGGAGPRDGPDPA